MNRITLFGIIVVIITVFLAGMSSAAEFPSTIITIQGGESTIMNGSDGKMEISVQDIIPEINITNGNMSYSTPVEELTNISCPAHAAVIFSDDQNEVTSLITISNLSLSSTNTILTLFASPLQYYDGEGLKSFTDTQTDLSKIDRDYNITRLYIETSVELAENSEQCPSGYFYCGMYGKCMSGSEMNLCMLQ